MLVMNERATHVLINVWFRPFSAGYGPAHRVWIAPTNDAEGDKSLNHSEDDWVAVKDGSPLSAALISLSGLGIPTVKRQSDSSRLRHCITRDEYEAILGEAGGK